MTTISSVQDGDWASMSTWSTGTVPTASDSVYLYHTITVSGDIEANVIEVCSGGSLVESENVILGSANGSHTASFNYVKYNVYANQTDNRRVHLRGFQLNVKMAVISCIHQGNGFTNFPLSFYVGFDQDDKTWMSDPSPPNIDNKLVDEPGEGKPTNGTEWRYTNSQYLEVTVHWPRSYTKYAEELRRMAAQPYNVLLCTPSQLFLGHIEAVTYRDTTGEIFYEAKVRVVEALGQ